MENLNLFHPRKIIERELEDVNKHIEGLNRVIKMYPMLTNSIKILLKDLIEKRKKLIS